MSGDSSRDDVGAEGVARRRAGLRRAGLPSSWRRRHPVSAGLMLAAVGLVAITAAVLAVAAHRLEPYLRERIVAGLEQRFQTRVELREFHVAVQHGQEGTWGLWATGRGLRIWPPHREGGDHPLETAVQSTPLIDLAEFSFHAPLRYPPDKTIRIPEVRLKGLTIEIPPRSERDRNSGIESALGSRTTVAPAPNAKQPGAVANVIVERVICDRTELTLESDKPGKLPLNFDIAHLTLTNLRNGEAMNFSADLINPRPKGPIHTSGRFGPWVGSDPGAAALSGTYRMDAADLGTFKGIAGSITSTGSYSGTLRAIVADGEAEVGDFRLTHFGNSVPLHTRFHARLDGTNGDTWLDAVDATLGNSHFTTHGKVVRVGMDIAGAVGVQAKPAASVAAGVPAGVRGHQIDLKVNIDRGSLADFLRLVTRSAAPILTGGVTAQATLHIPPGPEPVHERMTLEGHFHVQEARFTSEKVQSRIEGLSLRGQGRPGELKSARTDSVRSDMEGDFHMARGTITLPQLAYSVPGAEIDLAGTYGLDGPLHFDGKARMQATVSQMVGGWKGFLLKPVDRMFKKDGAGTEVPIEIRGTREQPQFTVDLGRFGHTSPQRPGGR